MSTWHSEGNTETLQKDLEYGEHYVRGFLFLVEFSLQIVMINPM